ncbi:MAG: AtpZ/AtpI family protein [Candidatus Falkowbacteria bacterium]
MKELISTYREELVLFAKLSAWIGAPIIPAIFLGKWLDGHFHTAPWLFLATMLLTFIGSMLMLVKETVAVIGKFAPDKKYERESDK